MKTENPITTETLEWQGITLSLSCQRGYARQEGLTPTCHPSAGAKYIEAAHNRDRLSLAFLERGSGSRIGRPARLRSRVARRRSRVAEMASAAGRAASVVAILSAEDMLLL